jgi:tRNA pseudouridine55 synthase
MPDRTFRRETASAWLVDKPAGPTSHDIVAMVRRQLRRRGLKVGHAGTLDPFATGLLIVLVGRATRLADLVSGQSKTYRATVQLGLRSVTGDPEGPISPGGPVPALPAIEAALEGLRGTIDQRVPIYSAVHVDGERLYAKARRGEEVEAPSRTIDIHELALLAHDADRGTIDIDVRCSKGTYIRQLAVDLGEALGCGGYCAALRRTAVGDLSVTDAVPLEGVATDGGIALAQLVSHLPQLAVDHAAGHEIGHGRAIPGEGAGEVALTVDGVLIALADADGKGSVHPRIVLVAPDSVGVAQ